MAQSQLDYLSYVELADDNRTLLINGRKDCTAKLPRDFMGKKLTAPERLKTTKSLILNTCTASDVDYISDENLTKVSKEVIDLRFDRAAQVKSIKEDKTGAVLK